jgi:hypothetical protein
LVSWLLAALVFLAPGMAGDLFVVIAKITGSMPAATWIAGLMLLGFYVLWFGMRVRRSGHRIIGRSEHRKKQKLTTDKHR